MSRRRGAAALQLPMLDAAEVDPASSACQRWRHGRHSWRRRRDGGFDKSRYHIRHIIGNKVAEQFVKAHHYLQSFPSSSANWGLYEGDELVGVAVFGVPSHNAVLTNVFPDLQRYTESLVLSRFVLLDAVPANGETWFLGQIFAAAAREGLRGVVTFADPVMRRAADGRVVVPGHRGHMYIAKGALPLGRSRADIVLVLPDGSSLDRRALSKVRHDECGHDYVERRLAGFGVAPRRPGESGEGYLARALPEAGVVALRHGGNYRFGFQLGMTTAERAAVRIGLPVTANPRTIDQISWEQAIPLVASTTPTFATPTLL